MRLSRYPLSPEEQCARLLARAAGTPVPTVDLPAAVLPEYEKSVTETLGEHPFVGNGPEGFASVVFRDHVLARALAAGGDARAARGLARSRGFKPSPLLVRYFVDSGQDEPAQIIDADDLDLLYASARAEEVGDARVGLVIEQTDSGLGVEIITARGELLEFLASQTADKCLGVGGRLARSDIQAPDWTVVVGRAGTEAVLGPDVTISCDRILVSAAGLRIEARSIDEAVTWQARRVEHEAGEFHLAGAHRDRLRIATSEQPGYPWTGFLSGQADDDDGGDPAIEDAVRELKKLATRFKPGVVSGTAPTLPVKIVDVLVARHRVSPDIYQYALETGLITISGKDCQLYPQQFGLNIVDLRERRITPAVRAYLTGYVRSRNS